VTDAKHTSHDKPAGDYRVPPNSPLAQAWKLALVIGVIGVLLAGFGYTVDARRFAFAYLMGFAIVLTMALGSVFFVLIQHLTGAGWSVTVRRASEFFASGMVIVPLLFIPAALSASQLYPWWDHHGEHGVAHAQPLDNRGHDDHGHDHGGHGHDHGAHGAAADVAHGDEHHDPEHAMHAQILEKKLGYLNQPFFWLRAVLYLFVWIFLADRLFRYSTSQDKNGDPQWTVKAQRAAPVLTILFAFSLTFAGFDWVMSLLPNWYSTMFGVRLFAASAVLALALNILLTLALRKSGAVKNEINAEHYHDLGKLMFGFLVFWAYISFSEFFLIWYAAIPEETMYFHMRWDSGSWRWVSISLVVVKFIVPFYLVMSRNVKRNPGLLGVGAAWIAIMHVVEMYYWVMPHFDASGVPASPVGFITDGGAIMACVGLYMAVVLRRMLNYPVIPVRDPRLHRALNHVNA
jgi:hypothetical protein